MLGEFIAACQALQDLKEHGPELYQQELLKHDVPRRLREASVKTFAESFSSARHTQKAVQRQPEVRQAKALLKLVAILDGAWGQWEYVQAAQKIEFKNPTQAADYNAAVEEYNRASKEYLELK
jgi:hypothetical protein